jgi:hypothetical protein
MWGTRLGRVSEVGHPPGMPRCHPIAIDGSGAFSLGVVFVANGTTHFFNKFLDNQIIFSLECPLMSEPSSQGSKPSSEAALAFANAGNLTAALKTLEQLAKNGVGEQCPRGFCGRLQDCLRRAKSENERTTFDLPGFHGSYRGLYIRSDGSL